MAAGKGEKNNNKTAGRGRPPGRPKGKNKPSMETVSSNYTLEEMRERKKRSMGQSDQADSAVTSSPAKRRSTTSVSTRTRSSSDGTDQNRSPSAIPIPSKSTANRKTGTTNTSGLPETPQPASQPTPASPIHEEEADSEVPMIPGVTLPSSSSQAFSEPASNNALNQLLDRFGAMENKLGKLDSMERQLNKLDGIESKTNSIDTEIHSIKKSVESIYSEMDTLKAKVRENQDTLRKELEEFKSQQKIQLAEAISTIRQEVMQESQKHFNAFTRHIESAFVREQAIARKGNLIFTGVQESTTRSDMTQILDICHSYLGISNISIDMVYRLGALKTGSNSPRPIMVKFKWMADRSRVWQAKKLLQRAPGGKIWVQEDMPRCLREDLRILLRVARQAFSLQKEEYRELKVKDFQLIFQGKSYSASELESLPPESRPSSLCIRGTEEALAFFGRYTPLSNHHRSPFQVNGVLYNTVEQYLAVARASLSGKKDLKEQALTQPDPVDSKKILNTLRDDHIEVWEEQRATVLMEALRHKFRQNNYLAKYLQETHPLLLGEASRDTVWGTGMSLSEDNTTDHTKWNAQGNLLGRSLMELRAELMEPNHGRPPDGVPRPQA